MPFSSAQAPHNAWLEVNLRQLQENIQTLMGRAHPTQIGLAIKANGYGHGLIPVAQTAIRAGVHLLCVARAAEALSLRKEGVHSPILLMGACEEEPLEDLARQQVELTISSLEQAHRLEAAAQRTRHPIRVHLDVDTGMHRTGMRPTDALKLVEQRHQFPHLIPVGLSTHFATADCPGHPATQAQWHAFATLLRHPRIQSLPLMKHSANSAAFLSCPDAHLDLVRIGLLAYGVHPIGRESPEPLRPCLQLKARVVFTQQVQGGEGISYGHRTILSRETRVVTVPVGYGDGYPRQTFPGGVVLIRGQRRPIVGVICMDQLMVDVGNMDVTLGEEVVLLGSQGAETITAHELAQHSGTIAWDILCRWTDRLPRAYLLPEDPTPHTLSDDHD